MFRLAFDHAPTFADMPRNSALASGRNAPLSVAVAAAG